jgi:hypothetical protein
MATLILPCAGNSSRYTETIPKFLLKNPLYDSLIMVACSIKGLPIDDYDKVCVVILEEHEKKYNATKEIEDNFEKIGLKDKLTVSIIKVSDSAADTVSQCITQESIEGLIIIKDCDDYFTVDGIGPNEIATVSLNDCGKIHASNKSYVSKNEEGLVLNIVEKQVISSDFCCGLYTFQQAKKFIEAHNEIKSYGSLDEIYISNIIFQLILQGESFKILKANNFIDWGTQEDWDDYKIKQNAGIL